MPKESRTFLVVADGSPEMELALRYAAQRARKVDGRVLLLHALEPTEIQPWAEIEAMLDQDAQTRAEAMLKPYETLVENICSRKPETIIRKGDRRALLVQVLEERPEISVLVLAASTGPDGPGPLISYFTSAKGIGKLKVPLVVVPDTYVLETDNPLI